MKDTAELFASLDALKARLDAHRPLPADIVSQIRQDMRIRFTYHSNAIEGNTLTMSETKAVLEDGITIGGKSLKEHLEAVGHSHAIDYMEALVQKDEARVHADFVNIHPFKDGNGRTARLIMNFELMRAGFPTVIVPVDARPDYYRNLDIAATQGDYLPFVMQIAELAQKSFAPYWALLGE